METAQLPASLLPQILTADKLLMPDGVTSIDRRLQQIGSGNLIDNADFSINQRGVTSWTSGYGLDRYKCGGLTAHVTDQGVRLVSGSDAYSNFHQIIDRPLQNGDVVTLSALTKGQRGFRLVIGRAHNSSNAWVDIPASEDWELVKVTATLSDLSTLIAKIDHPTAVAGEEISIQRWKLEPGPFQTLAHQEGNTWVLNDPPPNYALELEKCQRYQTNLFMGKWLGQTSLTLGRMLAATNHSGVLFAHLPTILRARPTAAFKNCVITPINNGNKMYSITSLAVARYNGNVVKINIEVDTDELVPQQSYEFTTSSADGFLILDANL